MELTKKLSIHIRSLREREIFQLAALVLAGGFVILWGKFLVYMPCILSLFASFVVFLMLYVAVAEWSLCKRRIFIKAVFSEGTLCSDLQKGKVLTFLALIPSFLLFSALLTGFFWWDHYQLALVFSSVFSCYLAYRCFSSCQVCRPTENFRPLVARQFALYVNSVALTVFLVVLGLLAPRKDLTDYQLGHLLQLAGQGVQASCDIVRAIEMFFTTQALFTEWLLQSFVGGYSDLGYLSVLVWVVFLLFQGAAAYAFVRCVLSVAR